MALVCPEEVISSDDGFRDNQGFHKVKRFLGQRPLRDTTEYLVQIRGRGTGRIRNLGPLLKP